MYESLGKNAGPFIGPERAKELYDLSANPSLFATEFDQALERQGITAITMPINEGDFKRLIDGFAVVLGECPEILSETYYYVDERKGNDAGHVRKERKFNEKGSQYQDPKDLFHFNERSHERWDEQFKNGPRALRDFLAAGYEIHNALVSVAKQSFSELEETHPNISTAFFPMLQPGAQTSTSFLRIVRYDSYRADDETLGPVAKPHWDISGATIQAYADAPGFWGANGGPGQERIAYDTADKQGYFFLGSGYNKLYGAESHLGHLYHGVDRVIPAGVTVVPERHAIILFINTPRVDFQTRIEDTLPELTGNIDNDLLEAAGYS